jgi:hypothetical protein
MTMHTAVYFKSSTGVHEVQLPVVDADLAVNHHRHEWSLDGKFAPAPEGFVFSAGDGGGLGRIAGASVKAD